MMKRIFCVFSAAILLLSLAGCSSKAKANTTYTGTVSAISADSVTLATSDGDVTIELTANTRMTMGGFGQMGSMPQGDWTMPADGERPARGNRPEGNFEKPEGDFERPEGDWTMPEGEMPDFGQFAEGEMPEGMTPPEGGSFEGLGGGFGSMDFSTIPVGTSLTITTGADKTAATISISMNFQGFGGQMPNFQN